MADCKYVIDTSSLIRLKEYPQDIFPIRSDLAKFVKDGRLVSPKAVLDELKPQDDEIYNWAKNQTKLFEGVKGKQAEWLKEIMNKYREWVNVNSGKNLADPYVVVLAISHKTLSKNTLSQKEVVVVTEESQDLKKLRLPKVCNDYSIRSMDLHDLFRNEGWTFVKR